MSERATVFCPFCNADGAKQPILSPMAVVYILSPGTAPAEGHDADREAAVKPATRGTSHFEYRCPRCGYIEIHERLLGAA